jgi:hypothetical protein
MQIQNPTPETKENEPSKEKEKEKEKHKSKDKETKKDSKVKQMSVYEIANEIRLLNSCQHKNIVKHIMSFMWKDHIWVRILHNHLYQNFSSRKIFFYRSMQLILFSDCDGIL